MAERVVTKVEQSVLVEYKITAERVSAFFL
jgi:hypothetical protein